MLLDIEVAGALAPGAHIVVYFAPNTDAGFVDALSQAAHADPTPAAISISWGLNEDEWTDQAKAAFDEALVDAAALGVTVTVAAGDDGSTDRASDGRAHVDFPAASPHALACGGTRLQADPRTGAVTSETVWNNGDGRRCHRRRRQHAPSACPAGRPARACPSRPAGPAAGVPDVAGVADPQTGYRVLVDGRSMVIGGTSAVVPAVGRAGRPDRAGHRPQARADPAGAVRRGAGRPGAARLPGRHRRQQRRLLAPARAGTRAPAWAFRTAPRCSPRCKADGSDARSAAG